MKEYKTAEGSGIGDQAFTINELVRAMKDIDVILQDYDEEKLVRYAEQALKNRVWDCHARDLETL